MSDIRRLMDSANPHDWQMALRQPGVTGEDLDYLLGRMHTEVGGWRKARVYDEKVVPDPEAVGGRRVEKLPTYNETANWEFSPSKRLPLPSELMAHPAFTADHMNQLVGIRTHLEPGSYGDREYSWHPTYRQSIVANIKNHSVPMDEGTFDRLLDDAPNWLREPEYLHDMVLHPKFVPGHMSRLLDAVLDSNLGNTKQPVSVFDPFLSSGSIPFSDFMDKHRELPGRYLDQWLDFAINHKDEVTTGHLVEAIGQHPNLTDGQFQKLITSEHPRRDILQHRQMSDSQLKAFLSDPRFQDPTDNYHDMYTVAQERAVSNQGIISPENAELASRSPSKMVRRAIARHPSAPDATLERMAEHEPAMWRSIALNPSASPELIHKMTEGAIHLLKNTSGPDDPRGDAMDALNSISEHPSLAPETIDLLRKSDLFAGSMRIKLAKHPKLTQNQIYDFASDPTHQVAVTLLDAQKQLKQITPAAIRTAWNTPRKGLHRSLVQEAILMHPEYSAALHETDIDRLMQSPHVTQMNTNAQKALFDHPKMPQEWVDKYLADPLSELHQHAATSPKTDAARLSNLLADPLLVPGHLAAAILRDNPNVSPEHVAMLALHHPDSATRASAVMHPMAQEDLHRAIDLPSEMPNVIQALAENPRTPEDVIQNIFNEPTVGFEQREAALKHHTVSDEALEQLSQEEGDPLSTRARRQLLIRRPDMKADPMKRVHVRFGTGKLRRIRDLAWEHDPMKGEIPPNKLPPGDWSAGRVASGNISGQKLQQVIDAAPANQYNTDDSEWKGAQRHSGDPSRVLRVNITNDHVQKMKDAGVYGTFQSMLRASYQSGHPIDEHHGVGWVRYTGTPTGTDVFTNQKVPGGFHIDEIQSDFGQSFVKVARQQAREHGRDEEEDARTAEKEWPEAHHKIISNIIFNGRHPNEVLGEVFMQRMRNLGYQGTPVHIHDVATKAPLSNMQPGKPAPGHMQFTYRDLPKKMGMKPDQYGKLATQKNPELKDKPTWSDQLRKMEGWLQDRGSGGDPLAQLGLAGAVERRLLAVQASGQIRPDPAMLREALVKHEDIDQAVLAVTGMDPKLLASITSLTKAEPEPTPERPPSQILPLTSSAKPVVEAVKRSFHLGRVKSVYLGGKHSAGSMLATDPKEHTVWYLKPGSGGQSPAMGVQEEIASQARREAGFWHTAAAWGLENYLPRAEVIVMDGHDWAALRFLDKDWKNFDDVRKERPGVAIEALEHLRRHGIVHRWAILDWVCGNTDRHGANLMLGAGGGVKLIDHGAAFAGPSFNPGNDPKSFVPFYLRYRAPQQWAAVPPAEKIQWMAPLNPGQDDELKRWAQNLDADQLVAIMHKDGLNPDWPLARLRQVQHLAATVQPGQFHAAVNRLWAGV